MNQYTYIQLNTYSMHLTLKAETHQSINSGEIMYMHAMPFPVENNARDLTQKQRTRIMRLS